MKKTKSNKLTRFILIALTAWCFYLLMHATGSLQDDFWYQREYVDISGGNHSENYNYFRSVNGDYITTWEQAINSCKNHYLYHDNARMANNIRLISNLAPDWVSDLLTSLMLVLLVGGLIKAARPSQSITPGLWGIALVLTFLYPWWQHPMLSMDFLMNYLWSAAFGVWAWIVIVNKPTKRRLWYLIPFCLFAGTMHEGFSVPIIAGLGTYLIINRKDSTLPQWMLLGSMTLGAAFIIFSPALLWEVSLRFQNSGHIKSSLFSTLSKETLNLIIYALILIILRLRSETPVFIKYLKESFPLFVVFISALIICGVSSAEIRALWIGDLALAIISLRAIIIAFPSLSDNGVQIGGWITTLAICCWFGMLSIWQGAASRNLQSLIDTARKSGDVIYFDLLTNDNFPFLSFNMVGGTSDVNEIQSALASISGLKRAKEKVVLPEKYRGIPFDSIPGMPGSAGLHGERFIYFYSGVKLSEKGELFNILYGDPGSNPDANKYSYSFLSKFLKRIRRRFSGIPDSYMDASAIPVAVTDEMRRSGICDKDTAWFYGFHFMPPHYNSCRIEAIDFVSSR